jgi:hypothetical protein
VHILQKLVASLREHPVLRHVSIGLAIVAVVLAASIVSTLMVDLGPAVRARAERAGSDWLKRAVRIGELQIHLATGRFVVRDLAIDGRSPTDRPFFTARELVVALDWSTAIRRRPEFTVTDVELTDWRMRVEEWRDGHNFPRFTRDRANQPQGPRRFTTTIRHVRAHRGEFSYENHSAPWSVSAPNIDLTIVRYPSYRGHATFSGGTIKIQDHLPMWANMKAEFRIDGERLHMDKVDIETDGARSSAVGDVNLSRWPEMRYDVKSRVHFPRMREIFFRNERWVLSGDGDFAGTFSLFKGGHDLAGTFASDVAGLYDYRFPELRGALRWTRKLFEVTDARSGLFGGTAAFAFSIAPLGEKVSPTARFNVRYKNVDVAEMSDFYNLRGVRFAGRAAGENVLEWPLGKFSRHRDEGRFTVEMPDGARPMSAAGPSDAAAALEWGPFGPVSLPAHVPVAGDATYRFDAEHIEAEGGRFVTERTNVVFEGATDWGERSAFRFRVASDDWQESDQILAGILTNFGSRTGAVAFGGRGTFEGTMSGPFRRPRVEGRFVGSDLRAWDTRWGAGSAHIVVENGYVTVADGVVRDGESTIHADGLFSLGYPRRDGGDEIDAVFRVTRRDLAGVRHAFGIDEYPLDGALSGEFHLAGEYERPIGFGTMLVEKGTAYHEPFDRGTASLRFDGQGVRLDAVNIVKGAGSMTGAAFIGWNSTYSFNAGAKRVPLESMSAFSYPQVQPVGVAEFTAGGSGTFDAPRWDVRFRINELHIANEPVGQLTGTLSLRDDELIGEIDAASPRLAVTGTGRIALSPPLQSELTFRFHDSSLDPYIRLFVPRLPPLTTATATGSMRVVGELANVDRLLVDGTVDSIELSLFDYTIRNAAPVKLALDRRVVRVGDLQLVGEDTRLKVGGTVSLVDQTIALSAVGDANLGILQGFFPNVRGSGRAELVAGIDGPLYEPIFSGSATIANGRVRHFSLPNALDAINGVIHFDSRGLRLDDVEARLGGGQVQFGGRIGFDGYLPGELNVSVRGENVQLRYPEGVRSVVDADLTLRGNVKTPMLGGAVTVRSAVWSRRVDPTGGLLDLGGGGGRAEGGAVVAQSTPPLRFDLELHVPSTLRIQNNLARLVARAELQLRGTYDRPLLFGRAEVDRGEVTFEGRRYLVTKGTVEFTNPTRIEPFFDVEAETRVRVPKQTYRVIVRAAGTMDRMQPELESDPPLPTGDVLALLFSDVRRDVGTGGDAELRALQRPNERQTDILAARATQLLASPVSQEVGRVVEQAFGVDAFQLTPSLIDPYSQSTTGRVNPSARVTIGKRVSDRVYLTFSRSLSSSFNDQILLLEYDESDRLSWILSRNEDNTYAIEVRVRHTF